ncbi:HesB/YadR/YfhF family protein [Fundicoccus culcitae]|uniref:Fe-S cluster assembly protein HesB n=1 Tax=Fundicoccus culcitae TaxID=2969821 RepID=A0ABY5P670_9LACT|nr:hypothetical protein [Fundicoccus culcitae]UUX34049.1 hypothetical protein NRE15_14380 [Fundicoccus culcitae]
MAAYDITLEVSNEAADWFKEEVGIPEGSGIRIKAKIYASSPINQGFGIAVDSEVPSKPIVKFEAPNGILFFIEDNDSWFFDGYGLKVELDKDLNEPKYIYLKDGKVVE